MDTVAASGQSVPSNSALLAFVECAWNESGGARRLELIKGLHVTDDLEKDMVKLQFDALHRFEQAALIGVVAMDNYDLFREMIGQGFL